MKTEKQIIAAIKRHEDLKDLSAGKGNDEAYNEQRIILDCLRWMLGNKN